MANNLTESSNSDSSTSPLPDGLQSPGSSTKTRRRPFQQKLHSVVRWLHIYSSLLGLAATLFFGVTGVTLNHPDWFDSGIEHVMEESGTLDKTLLGTATSDPSQLQIVELLRSRHHIQAPVRDLQVDDYLVSIGFAGPGYSADVRIDRETAEYQIYEVRLGLVAVVNDLHKGRDTGPIWSAVIDVSSVLLVFISLTGVLLLFWLKRRWRTGLLTILAGAILTLATILMTIV